jgi:hypothetical protein
MLTSEVNLVYINMYTAKKTSVEKDPRIALCNPKCSFHSSV